MLEGVFPSDRCCDFYPLAFAFFAKERGRERERGGGEEKETGRERGGNTHTTDRQTDRQTDRDREDRADVAGVNARALREHTHCGRERGVEGERERERGRG